MDEETLNNDINLLWVVSGMMTSDFFSRNLSVYVEEVGGRVRGEGDSWRENNMCRKVLVEQLMMTIVDKLLQHPLSLHFVYVWM